MNKKHNPPRRTARVWLVITLVAIVTIFIPEAVGIDGFDGGFAISFMAGFVAIMGIVAFIIYTRLARTLDGMLKQENLLAHWQYTPHEWKKYTEREHKEEKSGKKATFILVAVISAIVGVIFWALDPDHSPFVIIVVLSLDALIGIVAIGSVAYNHRQNKKYLGEAYITRDGVYLNRQLHIWKGIGNKLEDVRYEDSSRSQPRIVFDYSSPGRYSRNSYSARIPVPQGQEEQARIIVAQIAEKHLLAEGEGIIVESKD